MKMILATGEKSPICLEEGLAPVADMYLCSQNIYNSCLEEVNMISETTRRKMSEAHKGHVVTEETRKRLSEANKGRVVTDETRKKMSEAHKEQVPWNRGIKLSKELREKISKGQTGRILSQITRDKIALSHKGKTASDETRKKLSNAKRGGVLSENHKRKIANSLKGTRSKEHHPMWRGGKKLANARHYNNRRRRGFILLVASNPYNEPIVYHHIHPDLPYVVPCPVRIHEMFSGTEKAHFQNVNIMLGLRLEDCDFVNLLENIE